MKGGLHPGRPGGGFGLASALKVAVGDAGARGGAIPAGAAGPVAFGAAVAKVADAAGAADDVGGVGGVAGVGSVGGADATGSSVQAGWAAAWEGWGALASAAPALNAGSTTGSPPRWIATNRPIEQATTASAPTPATTGTNGDRRAGPDALIAGAAGGAPATGWFVVGSLGENVVSSSSIAIVRLTTEAGTLNCPGTVVIGLPKRSW